LGFESARVLGFESAFRTSAGLSMSLPQHSEKPRRAHRLTGNKQGRPRQLQETAFRERATKVFFAQVTEGETSDAARLAAFKWYRKKVTATEVKVSGRTMRRWWGRFDSALRTQVFVQEGPAGAPARHLVSLQALEAATNVHAVEAILCPHGYGQAQLSAGEQCAGDRTNGATSAKLFVELVALVLKYCLNLTTPTDGSPSELVGVDIGSGIGVVAWLAGLYGAHKEFYAMECVKARHDAAKILVASSPAQLQCRLEVMHGNCLHPCAELGFEAVLERANHATLNNVTYSQALNRQLCEGPLRKLPVGAVVTTLARLDAPFEFKRPRRAPDPAWTSARRPPAVQADGDMVVIFLDTAGASADPLAPRLEQVCVMEVQQGLGWTDTPAKVWAYRRAGGP
jgi:hypothetical protein